MKKINVLISLIFVLVSSVCIVSCSKPLEVTGFDVESEKSVEIGSIYKIENLVVRSADNKLCDINYYVENENKKVDLLNASFEIKSFSDYIITYTVEHDGKTIKKQTALKVKDDTAPIIKLGSQEDCVYMGDVIDLSKILVEDNSPLALKQLDISVKHNDKNIELSNEKTFTPSEEGAYVVTVLAMDNNENSDTKNFTINVIEKLSYGALFDFEKESNYGQSFISNQASFEQTNEKCAKGIRSLRAVCSGAWVGVNCVTIKASEFDFFNSVKLQIYVDSTTDAVSVTPFGSVAQTIKPNEWTQISVSKQAFKDSSLNVWSEGMTKFYLDDIKFAFDNLTEVVGEEINIDEKLQLTKNNLTITDIKIDGVASQSLTFTLADVKDYIVTFTATNGDKKKGNYSVIVKATPSKITIHDFEKADSESGFIPYGANIITRSTHQKASGDYSLKISNTGTYMNIKMPTIEFGTFNKISFKIYAVSTSATVSVLTPLGSDTVTISPNQWQTITINKDKAKNQDLIVWAENLTAFYIDDIMLEK